MGRSPPAALSPYIAYTFVAAESCSPTYSRNETYARPSASNAPTCSTSAVQVLIGTVCRVTIPSAVPSVSACRARRCSPGEAAETEAQSDREAASSGHIASTTALVALST